MPVLYVHGNHEGYGEKLDSIRVELVDLCAMTNHIHDLDCTELLLGTTRFLGTTLWTDFRLLGDDERPAALQAAQDRMNDYRQIRLASQGYRKLRASDTARWHQEEKVWLARKLAEPFSGETVVITHMAPSDSKPICRAPIVRRFRIPSGRPGGASGLVGPRPYS